MKVAIIMGSNSDWPVLEAAEKTLKEFGVETEVVVASAHRTPDVVQNFAKGARDRGVEVIIAAAGAAAHLGGFIAAFTTVPVIGIPINATRILTVRLVPLSSLALPVSARPSWLRPWPRCSLMMNATWFVSI
jgi:phosphoribosylaminoimidazole carboxylase PurE protein